MEKFELSERHSQLLTGMMELVAGATGAPMAVVIVAGSAEEMIGELERQIAQLSPAHRASATRVDFSKADRDWTPPAGEEPTSRGFFVGDRVIHPKYGGGIVIGNINGHTEVRFYDEDRRHCFIGVEADKLMLASFAEAAAAQGDKADERSTRLVGDRLFGQLAALDSMDGLVERALAVFAKHGYSVNLSFHKPDPTPDLAPTAQPE